jgi:23S rRNA (guanine745-N1)-methyltransferase
LQLLHEASNVSYVCPVCGGSLQLNPSGKSYVCQNQHSFDLAKEGYLNLLPVQHKHSKEPGDSKHMMLARREFLEAGFYEPMARAVAMMIDASKADDQSIRLLDLGCGEGYYSRKMADFCKHREQIALHGIDIAKFAIAAAAKKQPDARFIVASSNRLPYPDQYFAVVLRVFSPSDDDELKRILTSSGHLLTVTPGPRHLWQLKEFIYAEVTEHASESTVPQGFKRLSAQRISYKITPDPRQRMALLQMTPFAWRANESVQQSLSNVSDLDIETDFILTLSTKTAGVI